MKLTNGRGAIMTWQRIKMFILFVLLPITLSCDGCVRQQ